jgi:glycosyltransferase involved in cell wall biosynthesis
MIVPCAVSVVLSTRNRAHVLNPALENLLTQTSDVTYEVIVVDNDSTDRTRSIISAHMPNSADRLRYVFEPRRGLSHARNAGIASAQADLVAFTDDDVRVSGNWVAIISKTFAAHPDIHCLGGRTLPVWPSAPPPWLTKEHWVGPLALQDYGDAECVIDARRPRCLAGANFAFRKQIFDQVGLFSSDFPRAQDTEFLLRMYRAGYKSLYVPDMIVHAAVDPNRLTKAYHRRWHSAIGRFNARMRFEELADPVLGLRAEVPDLMRIAGVPLFAVRQLGRELWQWLVNTARGREAEAFVHENRSRALVSYMRETRRMPSDRNGASNDTARPAQVRPAPAMACTHPAADVAIHAQQLGRQP